VTTARASNDTTNAVIPRHRFGAFQARDTVSGTTAKRHIEAMSRADSEGASDMEITKGQATVPVNAIISRDDIITKFKLPADARIEFVHAGGTVAFEDAAISVEYTETRKPRAKKAVEA
jgi:hypothetical protein